VIGGIQDERLQGKKRVLREWGGVDGGGLKDGGDKGRKMGATGARKKVWRTIGEHPNLQGRKTKRGNTLWIAQKSVNFDKRKRKRKQFNRGDMNRGQKAGRGESSGSVGGGGGGGNSKR